MMGGAHDIKDVQIRQVDDGFVLRCACGWESHRHANVMQVAEEWQRHRDFVT